MNSQFFVLYREIRLLSVSGLSAHLSLGRGRTYYWMCLRALCLCCFSGLCVFVGAFEDDNVTHVEGDINPVRDIDIINEELRLKDVEYLRGVMDKLERTVLRGGDKKMKPEYVS